MVIKENRATESRPEGDRPLDAPVVPIDIRQVTKQLLSEKAWKKNDRNAITLFKTADIRVLLIALHPGAELHTGRPDNTLIFQVLRGKVVIQVGGRKEKLRKGQMLAMHEHIDYSVRSRNKAIVLLTVVE